MQERLDYSPQAQLDLDEIFDYFFCEQGNPSKAQKVVEEILSACKRIPGRAMRFPPVGPLPFTEDVYRFVAVGNYIVFFRKVDDVICVDRILYKRRDFASLLGL